MRHFSCLLWMKICYAAGRREEDAGSSGGLRWRDLSVSIPKNRKEITHLVEPSSGFIQNGHVMAIIGPSGAGKSTFLAALSGTTPKGKIVSGSIWMESLSSSSKGEPQKYPISISSGEIALLQQHDSFFHMLTPKETLSLAAFLQLDIDQHKREELVTNILDSLGLRSVETRKIGDRAAIQTGSIGSSGGGCLSGGERRRLSVAIELVSNPRVILADEPTSGLDSAQAKKVFDILAKSARERNIPCICTIHQPRASIWKELDSFILLAPGGKIVYMGDRKLAVSYFSRLGYKCPPETTTAEFFIDLVTLDNEDKIEAIRDQERIDKLVKSFQDHQAEMIGKELSAWDTLVDGKDTENLVSRKHPKFHSRVAALLVRSLRQNFRDTKVNVLRGFASLGLAKLFSELFSRVKKGQSLAKSVADRPALISFGVINMTMMAMMKTINLFGKEKNIVNREQMRRHYTSFDYLISKTLAEIPLDVVFSSIFAAALKIFTGLRMPFSRLCGTFSLLTVASASLGFAVGSFTSGVEEAMTVGMPLMVVFMAVGIINPSGVDASVSRPWFIRLLRRFSPIGMAIEALCVAEYKGMKFDDGGERWGLKDLPKMGGLGKCGKDKFDMLILFASPRPIAAVVAELKNLTTLTLNTSMVFLTFLAMVRNGDQVLEALALDKKSYRSIMNELAAVSALNLLLSWAGLAFGGSEFTQAKINQKESSIGKKEEEGTSTKTTTQTFVQEAPKVSSTRWFN